jgi:hypothetical protein
MKEDSGEIKCFEMNGAVSEQGTALFDAEELGGSIPPRVKSNRSHKSHHLFFDNI